MKYEELPKKEHKKFRELHEQRGRLIADGAEVVLTDWAIQNGISPRHYNERKYFKISNVKFNGSGIRVKAEGNKQPVSYWAGFWKPVE